MRQCSDKIVRIKLKYFFSFRQLTEAPRSHTYSDAVYIKPYCRIAPYLVGMALGYIFHQQKKSNPRMRLVRTKKSLGSQCYLFFVSRRLFPATMRAAARHCFPPQHARQPGLVFPRQCAPGIQALFPTTMHAPQPGIVFLRQCAPGSQALFPATVHARQPGLVSPPQCTLRNQAFFSYDSARPAARPCFPPQCVLGSQALFPATMHARQSTCPNQIFIQSWGYQMCGFHCVV